MKKNLLILGILSLGCALSFTSCGDDDDDNNGGNNGETSEDFYVSTAEYSSDNAAQWGNYMRVVSGLLVDDSKTLYDEWNKSFAQTFINHNSSNYLSAINCIETILDGCTDIASEVGATKIGEPVSLYESGKKTEALYAVESWFSWHSRVDYCNNIYSIKNSVFGSRNGVVNSSSISAILAEKNPEMNEKLISLINAAAKAIDDIPQPFRNNIGSSEAKTAQAACANLEEYISKYVKPYFQSNINSDDVLDPIVETYVNNVVLPTYKELAEANVALNSAVVAFQQNPSNDGFEKCCEAWLKAREPWETSEAFLFGPVADKGLDPNMDSWPLDQKSIENILKSQDFAELNWDGEYDEESEEIAKSQNLRGFHTLEFLIFKDGKARTIK